MGHVERHQQLDTHVTRWRPEATAAELALVELLTVAELHRQIDRIPSQLVKELGWTTDLVTPEPGECPRRWATGELPSRRRQCPVHARLVIPPYRPVLNKC